MSNYTKTTNFSTKDALVSGDTNKIVKGTELNTEFDNIVTAIATKADSATYANLASPTFTGDPKAPTPALGDNDTSIATTAFVQANTPLRGFIAGLTLSPNTTTSMPIAAGQAADSTNTVLLILTSAYTKTTSAWAVGTGNGGLDTGAIANSTWYYFYLIRRPDTGVTDVIFSLSSSAPTLPTSYTQYRYSGGGFTNGTAQWTAYTQVGDDFYWVTPVADFTGVGSTTAASLTCSVPRGRKVKAYFNINATATAQVILTDLANADIATSTSANAGNGGVASVSTGDFVAIWTNTSAQVRHRESSTGAIILSTSGWLDLRDRNL